MVTVTPDRFRAFVATRDGDDVRCAVTTLSLEDLPAADLTIRVRWSGVNYKDGLATLSTGRVARISPLVLGTDLAGTVIESSDPLRPVGSEVIAHGHELGMSHHGGFSEYARVPGAWTIPLPEGLTSRESMAFGTAGFTAARSVDVLERRGLRPGQGPVLVTGATGGVGGYAIGILARRGYEVWGLTRKPDAHAALRALGAVGFVDPTELEASDKALEHARWAGAIDTVGQASLPWILRTLRYGGAVAATGNVSGRELTTSVFPFILRDVALLGVDSATVAASERALIWQRLATDLRPTLLEERICEIGVDDLAQALKVVLTGDARGRYLVRLAG